LDSQTLLNPINGRKKSGVFERVAEEIKKFFFSKNFIAMIKAVCIMPKPNLGSTSQSSGLFMAVIIKAG
jgi:hypothetical protein